MEPDEMLPLLFLAYNRPDSLNNLMLSVLSQKHGKIYVHCDGPKDESDRQVYETQERIKYWKNQGFINDYLFQENNLGLMDSIHHALDWFFEKNAFGIILEDDLVVNYPALEEAEFLWRIINGSDHEKVFSLGNPLPAHLAKSIESSYWHSNFFVSYAWFTTSEIWKQSARSMNEFDFDEISNFMKINFGRFTAWNFRRFMRSELAKETNNRKSCSFAWRFTLDQISKKHVSIIATKNRIGYTGFGSSSTNTKGDEIWGSDFGKTVQLESSKWISSSEKHPKIEIDKYFVREFGFFRSLMTLIAIRTRIRKILAQTKSWNDFIGSQKNNRAKSKS